MGPSVNIMTCQVSMGIDCAREQKARSRNIIIASVPIIAFLMLFFADRFRRIKALRRYKAILKENCKQCGKK